MFLGGLNLNQFLSEHEEWHALVEGFCDGFFPFIKGVISDELKTDLGKEHHYYRPGVILGVIAAVWFWIGVYKAVI
jgi:hypothetical protein